MKLTKRARTPMFSSGMDGLETLFSNPGFMPHIHCYLGQPALVWTMFATDLLIGTAYVGISITLWALLRRIRLPFSFVVLCFGLFIAACGATHFMEVWTLWNPNYWLAAWFKIVTAIASVGTGIYLFQLRHPIVTVAEAAKLSEQRRLDLEALTTSLEKRVEERTLEVKENEERFRTLAESIPHLTWMARPDGYRFWFNRRWSEFSGVTVEDLAGDGWKELHDPALLPQVVEGWQAALKSGQPFSAEVHLRGADGNYRWFLSRAEPMRDYAGNIVRWIGTNTDIHEARRARMATAFLSEASRVLASSLNYNETLQAVARLAVPRLANWCSIDVVEADGPRSVAVANPDPALMALAEELRTKFPRDWNAPQGVGQVLRTGKPEIYPVITDAMLRAGNQGEDYYRIISALNIRSALIVPLRTRGRTVGALTLISSDETRRYGQEDLDLAEELGRRAGVAVDNSRNFEQAQNAIRLRDEFLSIASHELKTPITSLKLQTQMTKRRAAKGDDTVFERQSVTKLIDSTDRQTERLTKLVEDMLDISRITHGKLEIQPEDVDLGALVREVVDRFDAQLKAVGCEYRVNIENGVVGHWDRYRLDQVVTNLLTNAMKYGAGKPVEIGARKDDGHGLITVTDQGLGIARENQERIFNRFERAINFQNISGLGLGLYISKQIVDAHGGQIRVESALGKGSTFTVELPLHDVAQSANNH